MKVKNLIVGAGLTGAVLAEQIASVLGEEVLVVDRRGHVGGNCYDYKSESQITVQKYGPHILHTNDRDVWNYLSKFTGWHYFILKTKVFIDNTHTSIPFNLNSIHDLFPSLLASKIESKLLKKYPYGARIPILQLRNETSDSLLNFLADYIYEKMFKNYTYKQWGFYPNEIDSSVTARVPVVLSKNDGYFDDFYQAIPIDGYTNMIKNILSPKKISLMLNIDFKDLSGIEYERLFYTGSIDEFFSYKYGLLPYRSLYFDIQRKNVEYYQNYVTVRYPNNYDFTRIYEHKYFLHEHSNDTYITIEYPEEFIPDKNERLYPFPSNNSRELYKKYFNETLRLHNIFFCGRLGKYKYMNMDTAVRDAIDTIKSL